MKTKRNIILLVGVLLAVLAIIGLTQRDALRQWAFEQTGESDTVGQVRGLAQLALNVTNPPLDLAPYEAINEAGVNPYGMNTFLHQEVEPAKRERQVQLLSEAGFHWLREEFPWEDIEIHRQGDFIDRRNDPEGVDAWAKYDQIVETVNEYDMALIVRLSNPPAWSRAAPEGEIGPQAPPDDFDDFARFAATVAERYKGQIRHYQVWNEPNIYPEWGNQNVDPEAYTDLLCRTYDALKAVDPNIVVISGALAPTNELSGRDFNDFLFLQRMYDAGASACFDVLAMQGYMLWSGPTDRRMQPTVVNFGRNQFIRDIMVHNGDEHKAIWISEMNSNAAPPDVEPRYGRVTLEQQARYAPLAYQRAQEEWPWVGVVNFWYFKRADWTWLEERRPEAYFQMADPDFNLMPVYDSMKQYITDNPATMYPGTHPADHWAVDVGDGWEPWLHPEDRALAAGDNAEPLTFAFSGTSLGVVIGAHEEEGYGMTVSVDGKQVATLDDCCLRSTLWRGASGEHRATITPQGNLVITHFVVRDDPRITPGALVSGGLLLAGGAWMARRRHKAEQAGNEEM